MSSVSQNQISEPASENDETTTSTPKASPQERESYSRKKIKKEDPDDFEVQVLNRWDSMIKKKSSSYSRFGEEVAESVEAIAEPYARELAMRNIRDILFNAKYPQPNNAVTNSNGYSYTVMH